MQYTTTSSGQGTPKSGSDKGFYKAETLARLPVFAVRWDVAGYIWTGEYRVRAANSIEATKEAIAEFTGKLVNPAEALYWINRLNIRSVVEVSA